MMRYYGERTIRLNGNIPPCYGRVRDRYGCCYSVVNLSLEENYMLLDQEDNHNKGLAPIFCWTPEPRDVNKLFDFYADLNDRNGHVGLRIWRISQGGIVSDFILSDEEQAIVLKRLNTHCRRLFGKTCMELLKEARERMDPKELEGMVI